MTFPKVIDHSLLEQVFGSEIVQRVGKTQGSDPHSEEIQWSKLATVHYPIIHLISYGGWQAAPLCINANPGLSRVPQFNSVLFFRLLF